MLQIKISTLILLIGAAGVLLSVGFWLVAHFYRQWQFAHFFDQAQIYPNQMSRFELVPEPRSAAEAPDYSNDPNANIKLHYTVEGSGSDILLIHGLAANIYTWRKLSPLLKVRFRVWSVDMKGFGLSDKPRKSNYSLEAQADLLAQFLRMNNVNQCVLVGNSMGGAVAVELASRHENLVTGIVLMNSVHDPKVFKIDIKIFSRFVQLLIPMVGVLSPLVNRESIRPYLKSLYGPDYKITKQDIHGYLAPYMQSTAGNAAFMWALKGLMENSQVSKIRELRLPLLIIWGANDKIVPVQFGRQLHEALPKSQFEVQPTAGHHVQEEDPTWVAERIINFTQALAQ